LIRGLGEGGYGAVYEAHDRELDMRVALKQLHRFGPDSLLSFKREFRALADVRHPNVVRLFELFEDEGAWYFTMELVHGTDFCSYVRETTGPRAFHEGKLRDAMASLCRGLSAIHRVGLVHRDIKPENVRVTPEGRVVLLDFGLVSELHGTSRSDGQLVGTAYYMAPEQAEPQPVGPAADWYAAGVVLFEAMTGQLPFHGSAMDVLLQKHRALPPRPRALDLTIPEDLDELCMRLLSIEPSMRPSGGEVLILLRSTAVSAPSLSSALDPRKAASLAGRDDDLRRLRQALEEARERGPHLVVLEGDSGLGKSTLMARFANDVLLEEENLLLLSGQCYERENVPFKAFDGVVDALAYHLGGASESKYRHHLPEQVHLLARAFPVLERVRAIASAEGRAPTDKTAQRRLVFEGLGSLLTGLAQDALVLVCIDDLQWADTDSLSLLTFLITECEGLRVLFLATSRPVDKVADPLRGKLEDLLAAPRARRVGVLPVSSAAATDWVLVTGGKALTTAQVEAIVRESEGHPMFLAELLRAAMDEPAFEHGASLDEVLAHRVMRSSLAARTVVQLLSVATAPTSRNVLRDAVGILGEELVQVLSELFAGHLVRAYDGDDVECYHDRVRQAVAARLDPQTRAACHAKLARALEAHNPDASARIGTHYLFAGEARRALPWLERAARTAESTYAFESAVALYDQLLSLEVELDPARRRGFRIRRGHAFTNAGRSADAAQAYLEALDDAEPEEIAQLKLLAAQSLLQAGQVEPGLRVMRALFEESGLAFAETTRSALVRIAWHRVCLAFADPEREPVVDAQVSAQERTALDLLFGLAPALGWVDMMRGIELQNRHYRLALKVGDRRHLSLALGYEGAFLEAAAGSPKKIDRRIARAKELADRRGDPYLRAVASMSAGLVAFFRVQLPLARELLEEAERLYREECVGASWPLGVVRSNLLTTLLLQGEGGLHGARAGSWLKEAEARGDRLAYTALLLLGGGYSREVDEGRFDDAQAHVDAVMADWPAQPFCPQHLGHIIANVNIRRSRATDVEAHTYLEARWPEIAGSLLARGKFARASLLPIRAHCAMDAALVSKGAEREHLLAHAAAQLRALAKLDDPAVRVRRQLLAAQLALAHGKTELAVDTLRALLASADRDVLALERWAATYLLGRILAGDEGAELCDEALRWAGDRGYKQPLVPMRIIAPCVAMFD
jgi:hypothetical protein